MLVGQDLVTAYEDFVAAQGDTPEVLAILMQAAEIHAAIGAAMKGYHDHQMGLLQAEINLLKMVDTAALKTQVETLTLERNRLRIALQQITQIVGAVGSV